MKGDLEKIKTLKLENCWSTIIAEYSSRMEKEFWDDEEIIAEVGFAATQLNDFDRAIELYTRLTELQPRQAFYLYYLGYAYYIRGLNEKDNDDLRTAIDYFKKALDLKSEFPVCSYRLGKAYFMLTKYRKAIEAFSQVIDFFEGLYYRDAQKRFRKVYTKSLFNRGKAYRKIRSFDESIDDFSKAWSFDTFEYYDPVFYPYNLGKSYLAKKEYATAIEFLKKSLEMNPYKEWIHDQLGRAYMLAGEYEQASLCYEKALNIKKAVYIYVNRGILRYLSGDYNGARKDLYGALKRDKLGKHKIYVHLARIAIKENDPTKAEDLYRKAIDWKMEKYAAKYFNAHYELALLYQSMGRDEDAKEQWQIVEEIDPFIDLHDKREEIMIGEVA